MGGFLAPWAEFEKKNISYLELWQPLRSLERDYLCNFGRGRYGKPSCEVILNLDQWFKKRCCLKKKITDERTQDAQQKKTDHNSSP